MTTSKLEPTTPESTPIEVTQSLSQQNLDPLVASLTRTDSAANNKMSKVPIFGEIPIDGSILVLAPAAVIAVLGFALSIQIGFRAKDSLVEKLNEVNAVLAAPPVKKSVEYSSCRGLCSDQGEQLEQMRKFMGNLAKD
eukprot:CAMPEP_0184856072 /NCGR_PEP_ID=MMETSP0580-20130426/1226_1 /TAXON_ID=1118495 /ORGANISM="Dactyliosolen fragilissimus" /LENGTH=137 /DNA_ID=CAMNT_0027350849 /DNA_START=265 /DNA_END=678 /DNA_ORIENTATION=-